jgi:hypothetical protein
LSNTAAAAQAELHVQTLEMCRIATTAIAAVLVVQVREVSAGVSLRNQDCYCVIYTVSDLVLMQLIEVYWWCVTLEVCNTGYFLCYCSPITHAYARMLTL